MTRWRYWATLAMSSASTTVVANPPTDLEAWLWATACMACHGSGGEAIGVSLRLSGMPAQAMQGKLLAFKNGTQPSTVMRQHVVGYSDEELIRIARALAQLNTVGAR